MTVVIFPYAIPIYFQLSLFGLRFLFLLTPTLFDCVHLIQVEDMFSLMKCEKGTIPYFWQRAKCIQGILCKKM